MSIFGPVLCPTFQLCLPGSANFHEGWGSSKGGAPILASGALWYAARLLHYTEGLYNYILIHSCFGPDKRILSISFCLIHTIINQMWPPSPRHPLSWVLGSAADRLGSPEGVRDMTDRSQMPLKLKCKSLCKVLHFSDMLICGNMWAT